METKPFFKSKIVWLALLQLLFAAVNGFTKIVIPDPQNLATQITELDWTKVAMAIGSVLMLLFRVFFTNPRIVGLFTLTALLICGSILAARGDFSQKSTFACAVAPAMVPGEIRLASAALATHGSLSRSVPRAIVHGRNAAVSHSRRLRAFRPPGGRHGSC